MSNWLHRIIGSAAAPGRLQSIIGGAIDAGATPNVAYGGPTDVFRAMQAAQQGGMERDAIQAARVRQAMIDADMRTARDAAAAENMAQADYWQKKAELESQDRKYQATQPKSRRTAFNPVTGQLVDMDTAEVIGGPAKEQAPTIDVGVGPTGSTLDYGRGFEMGGVQYPSFGKVVPMAPGAAAELKRADAEIARATAKPTARPDQTVTFADATAYSLDPQRTPEERKYWGDVAKAIDSHEKSKASYGRTPHTPPAPQQQSAIVKNPDGTYSKIFKQVDRAGRVISESRIDNVPPPQTNPFAALLAGEAPAAQAPAAPKQSVVLIDPKTKEARRFTLSQEDLADALKKGYAVGK